MQTPVRQIARIVVATAAVGFAVMAYTFVTLPDVRGLATTNPSTTAFIDLRAREARAAGKKPRRVQVWIPYKRVSKNLTRAVLVAEDDLFWEHEGVDVEQLRQSLQLDLTKGAAVRGGSTITQQLAKNLYLSPSRNPLRKLRELVIARRLEAALPKARIFELYLNLIEWGDGIWGAEAAARTYFHTSASSVSAQQAALLAGAIVNPRLLNPAHPNARLVRRQRIILGRMGGVEPPPPMPTSPPPPAVVTEAPAVTPEVPSASQPEVSPEQSSEDGDQSGPPAAPPQP